MRAAILAALYAFSLSGASASEQSQRWFDPMFQRCVTWMLDGQRGAGLDRICLDEYEIPPPSLFLYARRVQTGFLSPTDREACAIVFEEEVKKIRAGFLR